MPEPPSRYSGAQKALHWTMAALIVTSSQYRDGHDEPRPGLATTQPLRAAIGYLLASASSASRAWSVRGAPPFSRCPTGSAAPRRSRMRRSMPVHPRLARRADRQRSSFARPEAVKVFLAVPVSLPNPDAPNMEAAGWISESETSASPSRLSSRSWRSRRRRALSTTSRPPATARCCACSPTEPHRGGSARRSRSPSPQAAAPRRHRPVGESCSRRPCRSRGTAAECRAAPRKRGVASAEAPGDLTRCTRRSLRRAMPASRSSVARGPAAGPKPLSRRWWAWEPASIAASAGCGGPDGAVGPVVGEGV